MYLNSLLGPTETAQSLAVLKAFLRALKFATLNIWLRQTVELWRSRALAI